MQKGVSNRAKQVIAWLLLIAAAIALVIGTDANRRVPSTEGAASGLGKSLAKRMDFLQSCMDKAMAHGGDSWMRMDGLPDDMVVYKYVDDTLRYWNNQFTLINDNIEDRMVVQALVGTPSLISSPLARASSTPELMDMGTKWYMVKSAVSADTCVIGGLMVMEDADGTESGGVNRKLHLDSRFVIQTMDCACGVPVFLDGHPVFKIYHDITVEPAGNMMYMFWIALLCLLASVALLMDAHRTLSQYLVSCLVIILSSVALYMAGEALPPGGQMMFSPSLYADGGLFYSLGAVVIVNLMIVAFAVCTYSARRPLSRLFMHSVRPVRIVAGLALAAFIIGIPVVALYEIRSVIFNSGITLELYKLHGLSVYSGIVELSLLSILLMVPLMLQIFRPIVYKRIRYDMLSGWTAVGVALATAVFLVLSSAVIGFRKEESRQTLWANRMSMTRDVMLEVRLRNTENAIASDAVIATLSAMDNSASLILNRIAENYLWRSSQAYNMQVYVMRDSKQAPEGVALFRSKMQNGQPIADNSKFLYSTAANGSTVYSGIFMYYMQGSGVSRMLLEITPRSSRPDKGYASLLGMSPPGVVTIPSNYSSARYSGRDLVSYNGNYAYPTRLNDRLEGIVHDASVRHFVENGCMHFVNHVDEDAVIVISRQRFGAFQYILATLFLAVIVYLALKLLSMLRRRPEMPVMSRNYYKNSVTVVLVVSLVVTLFVMAVVSVAFVYQRNNTNLSALMSEKVTSLQSLLQEECGLARSTEDLDSPEFLSVMRIAGEVSKTDVTLFSTDGKVFKSTVPVVYESMMLGSRLNQRAYEDIIYNHKRYSIRRERLGGKRFHAMYAPVFNADGRMLAILSAPYVDDNSDFGQQAVMHVVTIFTVFLILLLSARVAIGSISNKIFRPLVRMGDRMSSMDIDKLEYIQYDRDDEISALVKSYNRMVHDLSESSQKLAQAERDRAWSAMARQVAHEIKNPLTPMKLQLQRVIRLKQRGDPAWQDRFDECSKIILDHIDILTDTANEFSTFAKLYSEEPTVIDLNALLEEEIAMFDNRDDIEFLYMGLEGARVSGPKPQLTRVFVNLITNAVQAVDMRRQEDMDAGREPARGRVHVSLRNSSSHPDCYDVVVEDNGGGVSEENRGKLFTPNFTTKSAGTGLGLAICHSILEKCNASISYSRSFILGGACFTVTYPKL